MKKPKIITKIEEWDCILSSFGCGLRLAETSGCLLVQPSTQARSPWTGCLVPRPDGIWMSPREEKDSTAFLATCSSAWFLHIKKCFLMLRGNLWVSVCSLCLWSCHQWKEPGSPFRYLCALIRSLLSLVSFPAPSAFPHVGDAPAALPSLQHKCETAFLSTMLQKLQEK